MLWTRTNRNITETQVKLQASIMPLIEEIEARRLMSDTLTWDFAANTHTTGTSTNWSEGGFSIGNSLGTVANPNTTTSVSSGYVGASGTNNFGNAFRIGALNTTPTTGSGYYEVTLTPSSGFKVQLEDLNFGTRSTGTAPQLLTLRTSIDGYASDVASTSVTANSTWSLKDLSFAAITGAADTPVTLRLYGSNGAGSPGSNTINGRIDDVSLTVSAVANAGPVPTAPTLVSATAVSDSQINLVWNDNTDETGYVLDRSTTAGFTGGTVTTITGLPQDVTTYSDTGLAAGTTYYYRLRATNISGASLNSNVVSAMTNSGAPGTVADLTATTFSSSQINLAWTDLTNETSYELDISVRPNFASDGSFTTTTVTGIVAGSNSYSAMGLEPGVKYYFRLRGVNAVTGPNSNVATTGTALATGTTTNFAGGVSVYTQDFNHLNSTYVDNVGTIAGGGGTGLFSTGVAGAHDVVSSTFFSDKNAVLNGWAISREGGSDTTVRYGASDGTLNSGGAYSFGNSSDRALGVLVSNSNTAAIGSTFINTSGSTINNLSLSYIAETWRRAGNTSESATFQYKVVPIATPSSINESTGWSTFSSLDATTSGSGANVNTDGNNVSFKTARSGDLTGVGWTAGDKLVIRWLDTNDAGSDAGIGIDDFSMQITPVSAGTFGMTAAVTRGTEGGTATISITRSVGTSGPATVAYSIANLGATTGADYSDTNGGTVVFADGESSKTFTINLTADALNELNDKFTVTLTGVSGTTAPSGAIAGGAAVTTVTIVDGNGHALSGGAFTQDWTNTDMQITSANGWDTTYDITGFSSDSNRDAVNGGTPSVLVDLGNNPSGNSSGGVGEWNGLSDPTIALQGAGGSAQPQIVIDLDTTGVSSAQVEFDARDIDGSIDNAVQPVNVYYRVGVNGAVQLLGQITDATDGPSLAALVTHFSEALPGDALGQPLVQIIISTLDVTGSDEWVGIDNINIHQASALPAWLDPSSVATWDSGTKTLTVTGVATIIADPQTDAPNIVGTSSSAQLLVNPAVTGKVQLGTITLTGGATVTAQLHNLLPRAPIVLLTSGVSVDASSKIELHNNDLAVDFSSSGISPLTSVVGLVQTGFSSNFGIHSAELGTPAGTTFGVADDDTVLSLSGVTLVNPSQTVVIKYTWSGDANLDGKVDGTDYALTDSGFASPGTDFWNIGDYNYDGVVDGTDYSLIDTGFGSQTQVL